MPNIIGAGQLTLVDLNDVVASSTAPSNPMDGALWWDTTKSKLFVYSSGQWIESSRHEEYVRSRGENLITNGTGLLGDNTNFSSFVFDGSQSFAGGGSFFTDNQNSTMYNDELIPIDPSKRYRVSAMIKSSTGLGHQYVGLSYLDIDKNTVSSPHAIAHTFPIVSLAQDLQVGDTKIYLTSLDGFTDNQGDNTHWHSLAMWGYNNSFGYTYPEGTYTRLIFGYAWLNGAINTTEKSITFSKPFDLTNPNDAEGIFRTGHTLSRTHYGSGYAYGIASNVKFPTEWTKFEGLFKDVGWGNNKIWQGTAFARLLFLTNRSTSGGTAGDSFWLNNLFFSDVTDTEELGETVTDITETLGNMANDNLIDYNERQVIKDRLTEIIGYIIEDTASSLPVTSTLDNSVKGGFYSVRKSATNAGILTSESVYSAVATKYNDLRTYLDSLTPVKPWDLSISNQDSNITVVKETFRDKWLQYYIAIDDLSTATAQKLKENVDNIEVGGRNFISNGDFSFDLSQARWSSHYTGQTIETVDISTETPPFKFALHVNNTSNVHGGIFTPVIFEGDVANQLVGKEVTVSFWIKYQNIVQGTNSWNLGRFGELIIESEKSDSSKVYAYYRVGDNNEFDSIHVSGTDMTWKKCFATLKIPLHSDAVKVTKISFKHGIEGCTGEFWTTGLKLELGNKVTDWSADPLDIEGRVTSVESKVTPTAIVDTVTSSEQWLIMDEDVTKANDSIVDLKGLTRVRYIRDYVNQNTSSTSNLWIEIKAMVGETNVALNAPVTASGTTQSNLERVTDGDLTSSNFARSDGTGEQWVEVDLGEVYDNIDKLHIWHYYSDNRTYYGTRTEVSEDGVNWIVVFDSVVEGEYQESADGKEIPVNENVLSSFKDVGNELTLVKTDLSNVQQTISPDGITTVINESIFYENYVKDLSSKADASAIGDMVSRDEFNTLDGEVDGRISTAIGGIDFEPYATKLDLDERATNITAKFSASGGMNLLKNSIGFTDFIEKTVADQGDVRNWFVQGTQRASRIQTPELDTLGFGSGVQFMGGVVGQNTSLDQYINVIPNQLYTLSWYVNKTNSSSSSTDDGAFKIFAYEDGSTVRVNMLDPDSTASDPFTKTEYKYNSEVTTSGFETHHVVLRPTSSKIQLRLYAHGEANVVVSGLMFTIGDVALQWSLATGENYNTNVRLDINGIRVSQIDANRTEIGYTQITPDEFAGYWSQDSGNTFEKVFYLNADETVTKKLRALSEITMGGVKIIRIESTNSSGWAFVANEITDEYVSSGGSTSDTTLDGGTW